jgi:arylsulfatase A-like enzyme
MIRNIDRDVGRVLEKIRELEIDRKTLVIFSSDNGPHQEGRHQMEFFDSNGPLRGMKRDLYEGGVRVPTIAWWPGTVAAGGETDLLSGFQDFLPTVAELAEVKPPARLDGISLAPTLTGEGNQENHEYLYWEFQEKGGRVGVVTPKWKAVRLNTIQKPEGPVELYDLESDLGETENVAEKYPEVVKKLAKLIDDSHSEP